jgi:starch phosphorylase
MRKGSPAGASATAGTRTATRESASLYDKLENLVLPLFYHRPLEYARVMRSAIAFNGSFFNAQRMVSQYLINAYHPAHS